MCLVREVVAEALATQATQERPFLVLTQTHMSAADVHPQTASVQEATVAVRAAVGGVHVHTFVSMQARGCRKRLVTEAAFVLVFVAMLLGVVFVKQPLGLERLLTEAALDDALDIARLDGQTE